MQVTRHPYPLIVFSLLVCIFLTGCISYQPRVLVPSLTLSAQDIGIIESHADDSQNSGVDFGLEAAVNESDSLFNVEVLPGIRIRAVNPGSPASAAGIQPGDVVLSINGIQTNQPDVLYSLAQQTREETEFLFQIRRNTTILQASLIARPTGNSGTPLRELYRVDPIATRAGYRTELLSVRGQADMPAARIVTILPDSPLLTDGFNVDDIIVAIDGKPVGSAQGLINSVNTDYELGDTVSLTVFRKTQLHDRELTLWDPGRRISRLSLLPLLQYESTLSPQRTSFSLLDFWLFAIYRFDHSAGERRHQLLELFSFSSNYGELVEETQ